MEVKNDKDNRIDEYTDKDTVEEIVEQTEIPKQRDFYKIPRRFGSIPVDDSPLGCDTEHQYRKIYPRIPLPFQKADRVTFGHPDLEPNRLIWGDNLHVMRMLPSNSIDMIYIDPPFFSGRNYNVIFGDQNEIRSFDDIWEGGMPSYVIWLNARLLEMKRLLKPTGSFFIHLDWHAVHYIKIELDKIFGYDNFRNEIIWKRTTAHGDTKQGSKKFGQVHDTILWYSKSNDFKWNPQFVPFSDEQIKKQYNKTDENGRKYRLVTPTAAKGGGDVEYEFHGVSPPRGRFWAYKKEKLEEMNKKGLLYFSSSGQPYIKYFLDERPGVIVSTIWDDIKQIAPTSKERIGYPTQKAESLLERMIRTTTDEGDLVADFFCGGGTTSSVAQKLNRKWIVADQSRVAVAVTQSRLEALYEKTAGQQTLLNIPDTSIEYWGTYEVPALEELTQDEFTDFVVTSFGGRSSSAGNTIHGYKRETPIFVGSSKQSIPITKEDVITFAEEITKTKGKFQGIMVGWSFAQSARIAVEKLMQEGNFGVDLIQISQVDIESSEFRKHVTKLHNEYESFLKFILPPEVIVNHKRIKPMTYEFDASESMPLNEDSTIVNIQWDFEYLGRFTPTKGFAYDRDTKSKPLLNVQYKFERLGKITIACRVQDDLGGEKIYTEVISVR